MISQLFRKSAYLMMAVVLVAVTVAMVANFNVHTVYAGGSPQPLYQLISTEIGAGATFTVYTQAKINTFSTFTVVSSLGGSPYYISRLGTDHICIVKQADPNHIPLCIPFANIAAISYH